MMAAMSALHWLAGIVVVAESLNKLERSCPRRGSRSASEQAVEMVRIAAWGLLALGGAGAVVTPLLHLDPPSLQDVCALLGVAAYIVHTRITEGSNDRR